MTDDKESLYKLCAGNAIKLFHLENMDAKSWRREIDSARRGGAILPERSD